MIYVCCMAEMPDHVRTLRPGLLVSVIESAQQPPTPPGFPAERHLRIAVDDIGEPLEGMTHPERHHVEKLIAGLTSRPRAEPLLLHCYAGVSRSMASALIALVLDHPGEELAAAQHLRRRAPHAQPNRLMIRHADDILGLGGRLIEARAAMAPPQVQVIGPLVHVGRLGDL